MAQLRPRPLTSLPIAKLSTGCPQLDHCLGGGIPVGSLTEVVGEAAASKTQLCLQLLLCVQLPEAYGGLSGSAVYLYTEGSPAMQRLNQLAAALPSRYPPAALQGLPAPTANVFVEAGVASGAQLLARLQRLRPLLDSQHGCGSRRPVRLLVVDSVAHVFRELGEPGRGAAGALAGAGELTGRAELLFKVSALLRRYADEYGLVVLLVNQVVDSVDSGRGGAPAATAQPPGQQPRARPVKNTGHTGGLRLESVGREVVPALGLAWANCVNTRLFLSRCIAPDGLGPALFHGPCHAPAAAAGGSARAAGGLPPALRRLQVVFSPHLARGRECFYVVEGGGVRGLHPDELEQHHVAAAAAAHERLRQQQAWERQQQAWEREQAWGQHQRAQEQGMAQQPLGQWQGQAAWEQPLGHGQQPQHAGAAGRQARPSQCGTTSLPTAAACAACPLARN